MTPSIVKMGKNAGDWWTTCSTVIRFDMNFLVLAFQETDNEKVAGMHVLGYVCFD